MAGKLRILVVVIALVALLDVLLAYAGPSKKVTIPVTEEGTPTDDAKAMLVRKRTPLKLHVTRPRDLCGGTPPYGYFVTFRVIEDVPPEVAELHRERSASTPPKPVRMRFYFDGDPLEVGLRGGYIEWEGSYRRSVVWGVVDLKAGVDAVIRFDAGGTLAPNEGDDYGYYTLVRVDVLVYWNPSTEWLFVGVIDYDADPYNAHGYAVYGGYASVTLYPPYNRYHRHILVIGNLGSTTVSYSGHVQWQTAYENEPAGTDKKE